MKKLFTFLATALAATMVWAGVNITLVDKVAPTDEIFMDMAVTAAKRAQSENGGKPIGAVVILNGAWRSTGLPAGDKTAEEVAFEKSRRQTLHNATVYTVHEPTTRAYNALNAAGAEAIYFVNDRDEAVAAGIYPASAYNDALIDTTVAQVKLIRIPYDDAAALLAR